MAVFAKRSADSPIAKYSDGKATGDVLNIGNALNVQGGYLFKNNIQVTGRYTTIDLDDTISDLGKETQYTVGLSKYIVGHKLKIQTDVSLTDYETNANNLLTYRLQVDIHF